MVDSTVNPVDALMQSSGLGAGGAESRQKSQSRRMNGSGQSESASRTWRSAMPSLSGFGSGTRIGLAIS